MSIRLGFIGKILGIKTEHEENLELLNLLIKEKVAAKDIINGRPAEISVSVTKSDNGYQLIYYANNEMSGALEESRKLNFDNSGQLVSGIADDGDRTTELGEHALNASWESIMQTVLTQKVAKSSVPAFIA